MTTIRFCLLVAVILGPIAAASAYTASIDTVMLVSPPASATVVTFTVTLANAAEPIPGFHLDEIYAAQGVLHVANHGGSNITIASTSGTTSFFVTVSLNEPCWRIRITESCGLL